VAVSGAHWLSPPPFVKTGLEAVNDSPGDLRARGGGRRRHPLGLSQPARQPERGVRDGAYRGSHRFTYTARATTPGTFLAAPVKAEEMYTLETFGRSMGQVVVIQQ
jgi:hypothetical protein